MSSSACSESPAATLSTIPQHYIKCVAIGDGAVGKTCMLHTYTTNKFPWDYEPTVFDNYAVTVHIGKQAITLGISFLFQPILIQNFICNSSKFTPNLKKIKNLDFFNGKFMFIQR